MAQSYSSTTAPAVFEVHREVLPGDPEAHSYGVAIGEVNGNGLPDLDFANSGSLNRIHLQTRRELADAILRR